MISKISTERDQLKKRIIDLKTEVQKIKEKQFKKAQVDKLTKMYEKKEHEHYVLSIKHQK